MRRLVLAVMVAVAAVGATASAGHAPPRAHASAVCADYPNQAAAQKAKDTRDADGDGIYCEDLPCPCSTAGSHDSGSTQPTSSGGLGRSVTLGPWTKHDNCHLRGELPDRACTPGAIYRLATRSKICVSGYSKRVRNVPQSRKDAVYAAYGIAQHFNGQNGEVDHLVSLELGGSNSTANLWPEAAPASKRKDKLENQLHAEVCSGQLTLRKAQHLIATNWIASAKRAGL